MKIYVLAAVLMTSLISEFVFGENLDDISRFSMQICDSIRTDGAITKKEIVGKLNGELQGIAKLIGASVAADGTIKIENTSYSGLPYDALPAQMQDARACRKEIAKMLLEERKKVKTRRPTIKPSPPAHEKPNPPSSLPPGFSIDKEGFILNPSGNRLCQRKEIPDPPIIKSTNFGEYYHQSYSHEKTCQLWDGSWIVTR